MATVDFTLEDVQKMMVQERQHTQAMIDKAVDRLDQRIDRLETKLDRRFDTVDYRLERLESRLDDVDENLAAHARLSYEENAKLVTRVGRLEQKRG